MGLGSGARTRQPLFLVINKVDQVHPEGQLLPFLAEMSERIPASGVVPSRRSDARQSRAAGRTWAIAAAGRAAAVRAGCADRSGRAVSCGRIVREKLTAQAAR